MFEIAHLRNKITIDTVLQAPMVAEPLFPKLAPVFKAANDPRLTAFGRLIRRKTDRGLVAILDRRILTRSYGAVFLKSLPACPRLGELEEATAFLESL